MKHQDIRTVRADAVEALDARAGPNVARIASGGEYNSYVRLAAYGNSSGAQSATRGRPEQRHERLGDSPQHLIDAQRQQGTEPCGELVARQVEDLSDRFQAEVVKRFDGLVVDCAKKVGAQVMCRGIRAVSDFEFEFQMALMNRRLSPELEVVFLMPSARYTFLNSTLVKEIARLGGDITGLLPPAVEKRLLALFAEDRARYRKDA